MTVAAILTVKLHGRTQCANAVPKQGFFRLANFVPNSIGTQLIFFAHYPALPAFGNNLQPALGGNEVLGLLSEHRVTGFLFGHRHRNGFRFHERTAHVLTDNMGTIHLLHVLPDRVVIGRKRVGAPLYEQLTVYSPRN